MAEQKIGTVIHYWGKAGVAGVKVTDGELRVGDTIHVKGHTSDFIQQTMGRGFADHPGGTPAGRTNKAPFSIHIEYGLGPGSDNMPLS